MSVRARRSLIVLALAATVTVAALAVAWYVLGEERRLGRLLTGVLASRTGLPISVERAAMDGSRLRLRGVRLPATAGRPLDVRIGEVEVIGGVLPLLAPSGRRVSAVARATSVTVPESAGGPPDAAGLDALRVAGYGLALGQATSTARIADGRLLLPDISYTQYGGQGRGWLEAALDGRPAPFRTRLEGQGVDLGRFVRESGSNVAHLAGKVRYLASVQYTTPDGLVALVRTDSEDGGEVGIDAIERLLESAAVQAESSGVLRLTLENLRVFQYESLEGELRLSRGDGRVDLTLRGKKRLGIFPAPVEAINVRNVPLAVLARTFTRGDTPLRARNDT